MPTFIKTGYWESAVKSYKGWLNLEDLISNSITSSDVTNALGYTPVPTTRTLTINGVTQDLSVNRTFTVSSDNIYTANGTLTADRTVTSNGNSLTILGGKETFAGEQRALWLKTSTNAKSSVQILLENTFTTTGKTYEIGSDSSGAFNISDRTASAVRLKIDNLYFQFHSNASSNANLLGQVAGINALWFNQGALTATTANYTLCNANAITLLNAPTGGEIRFRVGNAEKMMLTNAGRLLLGTTTEGTDLLLVNGTARITGDTTFLKTGGTFGLYIRTTASTNPSIQYMYNGGASFGQTIGFGFGATTVTGWDNAGAGGGAIFNIAASAATTGNLFSILKGADTNPDPNWAFGITASADLICKNGATIRAQSFAYAVGGALNVQGGSPRGDVPNASGGNLNINGGVGTGTGTPGDVILATATPTTSGTTVQTLTNRVWVKGENGNVGIGASPNASYKLDVQGIVAAVNAMYINSASDALFYFQKNGANKWRIGNADVGDLNYFQLYDSVSNLERIRWNNNSTATFTSDFTFVGNTNAPVTVQSTQPTFLVEAIGATNSVNIDLKPSGGANSTIRNIGGSSIEFHTGSTPSLSATIKASKAFVTSSTLGYNGVEDSVKSAKYTPTLTNGTNVSSSAVNDNVFKYIRVGNVVNVSGWLSFTATAANTLTELEISLPIASNITSNEDVSGVANTLLGGYGQIRENATNNTAKMFVQPTSTSNLVWYIEFTYVII
jgi:hypothetical protein